MPVIRPLKDTQRIVDWEELPAKVRDIPEGLDPLAEGVLMGHQAAWIRIKAAIKAAEKGRRTGITFCEALDDTITAATRKSAGGDNVFYIGDTKEKGLEFIGYCARFARLMAQAQSQGISDIEEFLFVDQDEKGNTREITAYRIRFASGFRITALSSRPANIRGLQGIVVIDEAAFHADVQGVLDAATALLIWGGKIRIISSHNGKNNPFNEFVRDIRAGRYGSKEDAQVFKVTFDDAVANGLYERVCLMKGEPATAEGKKKWYLRIRNSYGPRTAAMREELDAIPRDSGGLSIPGIWIERAMPEELPVLRIVCDDDFDAWPVSERQKWANAWIKAELEPLLGSLDRGLAHVAGMDFARHRHFSVITPLAIQQNLYRKAPFVVEMQNTPINQQMQVLWALLRALPKFSGCAIDATGPGMGLAELTADEFGRTIIHQVDLSRKWYAEWMPKMTKGFEDGIYLLPRDASLEGDLRAVESIDGIPMVPKVQRKDLKDPDLYRHGDFAISLALGEYMAINRSYGLPSVITAGVQHISALTAGYHTLPRLSAY
jgi:phage FluMu gp28-like protein